MKTHVRRSRPAVCGAAVLSSAAIALLTASCSVSGSTAQQSSGGNIIIGDAGGFSGVYAPYELPALQGAELAIAQINAQGGVLGRKLKLVTVNMNSQINQSATAGQTVMHDGASASIVPLDVNYGGGAAQVVTSAGAVAVAPGGGGDQWAKFNPLAFSDGTTGTSDGAAMAQAAYGAGKHTAYMLVDTISSYSTELCSGFQKEFTKLGGTILGRDTFNNNDSTISPQITRMSALAHAPAAIALCSFPPGGALAVKQIRDAGINTEIYSSNGMDGTFWYAKTMPHLNGVTTVDWASVWGDDPSPAINNVVAQLKAKYGQPQNQFGIAGYVAVRAIAKAMQLAGTTDGAKVAQKLENFDGVNVGIPLSYTPGDHMAQSLAYRVITVTNGEPHYVRTLSPAAAG